MFRFLTTALIIVLLLLPGEVKGQPDTIVLENTDIRGVVTSAGIMSLISPSDPYRADIISPGSTWGSTKITVQGTSGEWVETDASADMVNIAENGTVRIVNSGSDSLLVLEKIYTLKEKSIDLDIIIRSETNHPLRIGDLAISFPWRMAEGEDPVYIFEQCFTKHHFISGNGSFIYFTKPSGMPPFIMVLPRKGTKFEYFDNDSSGYKAYILSERSSSMVQSGTWRQPNTGSDLAPKGESGSFVSYGLRFRWAKGWDEMRDILYEEGLFDVRVIPGMSVPTDLKATFSLHTKNKIDSVVPEFPDKTTIRYLGEKQPGYHIFEVSFKKLGENMLTVNYDGSSKMYLEFFCTEPIETLVKKRSSFIVNSTQHLDTTRWYHGLFSAYDMKNGVLRGPDNTDGYDGWWGYVLASDDPGLCKAPFVAAKNVFFPEDKEIAAVEYYLEHFVWNGLQRTDSDDPFPYGIYGVPNWKEARDPVARAKISTKNLDKMRIWRSYDYPHIVMLYYHMYQIAKMYPDKVNYLDADGYLERAWQTARAYFIYPYEILSWYDTYKWGCYNELVIEPLVNDLIKEGRTEEATWLKGEYEKKVKYFVYDDKYPFRSEYALDRTAFESSYAFAKYGSLNEMKADTNLWYDKNDSIWRSHPVVRRKDSRDFMERQHYAGLAVRGWLETKYFLLGSDFSNSSDDHCLSYMARMGGWSILDYGIHFAEKPYDWIQLGYASYLAPFSLMNTGTPETNYGYWFPGKQNDGAMGWAFMESKRGHAWIRKDIDRGAWYYDGEADLGNGAIFRTSQTVLSNDPLFGWTVYGGILGTGEKGHTVIPRDGVRNRFSIVTDNVRKTISLDHDGFATERGIIVSDGLDKLTFTLENRTGGKHKTILSIFSISEDIPEISVDGKRLPVTRMGERTYEAEIPISKATHKVIIQ